MLAGETPRPPVADDAARTGDDGARSANTSANSANDFDDTAIQRWEDDGGGGAITNIPEESPNGVILGDLESTGSNTYQSSGGLQYGFDHNYGNRLNHVMRHAIDSPSNTHPKGWGVFNDSDQPSVLALIDEAYIRAQDPSGAFRRGNPVIQNNGYIRMEIFMGRDIGYIGGQVGATQGYPDAQYIRLVLSGTNYDNVITAFPVR